MKDLNFYFIFIVLNFPLASYAWFESCDNVEYVFTPITYFRSKWYSSVGTYRYESGTSCKLQAIAPPGYNIKATCNLVIDNPLANCGSQRFYISRDGDSQLRDAEYWCGTWTALTRTSIGNEMTLAYTSNTGAAGKFECTLQAVAITAATCDCGWSATTKIVNGTETAINEFVSMVGFYDIPTNDVFCGGAIISDRYILTGAHCFVAYTDTRNMKIIVGDHDYKKTGETKYETTYLIETLRSHENYSSSAAYPYSDIALVRTSSTIKFNRGVGPACLPTLALWAATTFFDNKDLVVPGWGMLIYAGQSSDVLLKTTLLGYSNINCNKSLPEEKIISSQLCTYKKSYDTCQKDSGGSLYYLSGGRKFTVGIVSYGFYCGSLYPSVNTRVSSFLTWIRTNTNGAFFCTKS